MYLEAVPTEHSLRHDRGLNAINQGGAAYFFSGTKNKFPAGPTDPETPNGSILKIIPSFPFLRKYLIRNAKLSQCTLKYK
jgi:hypothetical protein